MFHNAQFLEPDNLNLELKYSFYSVLPGPTSQLHFLVQWTGHIFLSSLDFCFLSSWTYTSQFLEQKIPSSSGKYFLVPRADTSQFLGQILPSSSGRYFLVPRANTPEFLGQIIPSFWGKYFQLLGHILTSSLDKYFLVPRANNSQFLGQILLVPWIYTSQFLGHISPSSLDIHLSPSFLNKRMRLIVKLSENMHVRHTCKYPYSPFWCPILCKYPCTAVHYITVQYSRVSCTSVCLYLKKPVQLLLCIKDHNNKGRSRNMLSTPPNLDIQFYRNN